MSEQVKSTLTFDEYSVSEMVFKRNYEFDANQEVDLSFSLNGSANISENLDEAWLDIICTVFKEEFENGEAPFYLKIGMTGKFGLRVKEEELDIQSFQMNGMAILLPYLRSLITSFTSQSGMSPIILPPINVYNAFKLVESDQEDTE